jgi:hypothetical protein
MARTVRVRDLAAVLLVELALEADGTGYELDIDGVSPGPTVWRRQTSTSPWIDGFSDGTLTKDGRSFQITLRVVGASNVQVETLLQDLLAAVELPAFLLEVEVDGVGTTWRASCADSAWSWLSTEMVYTYRTVQLTIPVQPTPTITGLGG